MNSIIGTGAVMSLYLAIFIITKKKKDLSDIYLFTFFVINSVAFIISFISFEFRMKDLQFFLINIDLLITPIWYIYLSVLVRGKKYSRLAVTKHLSAYILSGLYLTYMALSLTTTEFDEIIYRPFLDQPLLFGLISMAEFLVVPFYVLLSIKLLVAHKNKVSNVYSYTKGVSLSWVRTILALNILSWLSLYVPYFVNDDSEMLLGLTINGFLILYFGFFGIRQASLIAETKGIEKKYEKSEIKEADLNRYKKRLLDFMSNEKPYLDNELNIHKLAKSVEITSHQLSQVLNTALNKSFYDFVNSYRVDEFKSRLEDEDSSNYTLLAIAMDSGFNSKSSFNRVFKQITGETPSVYYKSIK